MLEWKTVTTAPTTTIIDAMKIIESKAMQIVLVTDMHGKLLGTVTDGDIRRGILKGISLNEPVTLIMKKNPITAHCDQSLEVIFRMMRELGIKQIPVVDGDGRIVRLELLDKIIKTSTKDNLVVIMAGGLGTRLKPLTDSCPKPMVSVGGKPVLETIINSFIDQGFNNFVIALNHMAESIQGYFGDGSKWNANIDYLIEDKRLGTAGALSLLSSRTDKSILVMNGDLLTKVNFIHLLDFHREQRATATMCVREYSVQIPYGVVDFNENHLNKIEEKPVQTYFVNAGIYVLEPEVLYLIPQNQYYDMTTIFEKLIANKMATTVFPIREYWIDIGHHQDYEKANSEYTDIFHPVELADDIKLQCRGTNTEKSIARS